MRKLKKYKLKWTFNGIPRSIYCHHYSVKECLASVKGSNKSAKLVRTQNKP